MSMDWKANEAPRGDKTALSPALIIGVVVGIFALVFILQNARNSQVKFLFWDGTISLWVVIVISLIVGAILDRIVIWWLRRRKATAR